METRGTVISLHRLGATVRLSDGSLVSVPLGEVTAHYDRFLASLSKREPLSLILAANGGRRSAFLARGDRVPAPSTAQVGAPPRLDDLFEEQMRRYLKSTEEWAPPDRPEPAQRHFIRKKRRAAHFEARSKAT
ncbi:MAG: hypothetical protein JO060_03400 [Candidatus Eremiobacteraeota bacterium]|nr:hypothetical protein [Candidatus Eremiobacteraeota bacterium]MBV9646517.1 hypothetical protein [Candidatus Eremiobacteraeota bacterium]